MKNLIVVRHGNYNSLEDDGGLIDFGGKQIQRLGNFIKMNFEESFHFCCSPLLRTKQSAKILQDICGGVFEILDVLNNEYENLFIDSTYPGQAERIHAAVLERGNRVDNLVLVAHYSIKDYIEHYMKQEWQMEKNIADIPKGKAINLDLENRIHRVIPYNRKNIQSN